MEFLTISYDYCKIFFSSILTCFSFRRRKTGLTPPVAALTFPHEKAQKIPLLSEESKGRKSLTFFSGRDIIFL